MNEGSMEDLLTYNLIKSNRNVTKWLNNKIVGSGYSVTQIYLMWATKLYYPQNLTDISKKLSMDRSTYIRTVQKMKDVIELRFIKGDIRCKYPVLTKEGEAIIDEWIPKIKKLDKQILDSLGDDKLDLFSGLISLDSKFSKKKKGS